MVHKDLTIEGYSRAAVQTYWRLPEFKIGFDLGAQPWSFMGTPTWLVSHTHLDHIAALPVYVARRRMMKMEPPVIYLPEGAIDPVSKLLKLVTKLDRGRLPCDLRPIVPGDEIELSREHVVTVSATKHTVPSLGFVLWERRRKLKPEFQNLPGEKIRDLRLSGTEVTSEIRIARFAYLGDSAPEGLDACPAMYEAQVLVMEITFVAPLAPQGQDPQVRPYPLGRHRRTPCPISKRTGHRLALQHALQRCPHPAAGGQSASGHARRPLEFVALKRKPTDCVRGSLRCDRLFRASGTHGRSPWALERVSLRSRAQARRIKSASRRDRFHAAAELHHVFAQLVQLHCTSSDGRGRFRN